MTDFIYIYIYINEIRLYIIQFQCIHIFGFGIVSNLISFLTLFRYLLSKYVYRVYAS